MDGIACEKPLLEALESATTPSLLTYMACHGPSCHRILSAIYDAFLSASGLGHRHVTTCFAAELHTHQLKGGQVGSDWYHI